jgi:hypothetical protein
MNEPEYIVEDAADIVFENISLALQRKLSVEDIIEILETEFAFLKQAGVARDQPSVIDVPITIPIQVDDEALAYFIIHRCAQKDIYLTHQELREIMDAETVYLEQIGVIDDGGLGKYYN